MLSISTIRRASYFTELASSDYYFSGGEREGSWLIVSGSESKRDGVVSQDSLENILNGHSRDGGERLIKSHSRRQKGWDLTFSAPKSVSVLYAITPAKVRGQVFKAHEKAVEAAAEYLVREAILARRGKGGSEFENVEQILAAAFPHVTSRSADPALHTHLLLANIARRFDGTYGAIWSKEVYRHKLAAGAVYRAELAHQLQQRLGVLTYRVRDWFEVVGIPKALRREFSKRSREVRNIAREYGLSSPKFLELVTKLSRGVKGHLSHKELHERWRKVAARFGFTAQLVNRLLGWRRPKLSEKRANRVAARAASDAIEALSKRRSYFTEKDIVQHAAPSLMGRGGGAELLMRAAEIAKGRLIKLDAPGLRYDHFTTMEQYYTEKKVLKLVKQYGLKNGHKPVPFARLLRIFDKQAKYGTDERGHQQRKDKLNLEAAVRHQVCSGEQVRFIVGKQLSGKTTALKLAKQALEDEGYDVICCSPTSAGAKELRREVGGDCVTVGTLLDTVSPSYKRRTRHAAKQLYRTIRGRKTHRRGEKKLEKEEKILHYLANLKRLMKAKLPTFAGNLRLTKKTVVLVDQGEKLDTRTAHELLKAISKSGSAVRIALSQDSPAGAGPGGVFHHAAEKIGAFQLHREQRPETEVWRQIAHEALRDNNPEEFLSKYRKTKNLKESPTLRKAIAAIAKDWVADQAKANEKLVIASDPEEVRRINKAIQRERAKRFSVALGGVKVPSGDEIRSGDLVRFEKKSRFLGVDSGDTGKVLSVARSGRNPLHKKILVRVDEKTRFGILPRVVTVCTRRYKELSLGYAVLPHQAEAKSKSVRVLVNPERATRESMLHQVTRSKKKTRLYTVKSDAAQETDLLLDSLRQQREKLTAHQLEERQKQKHRMAMGSV